jgi:hypothetical protein
MWNGAASVQILSLSVPFKWFINRHEHIYEGITETVIRGDEMPKDTVAMERLLGGAQVILSTLGMLSNPALDDNGTFRLVPVQKLVIDEASQINVFEYLVSISNRLLKSVSRLTCSIFLRVFSKSFQIWKKSAFLVILSSVRLESELECMCY